MKQICLLRGINVGGHNKIKMADLKELLESLNLKNVQTYIQSGNIVFESTKDNLEKEIAKAIKSKFEFDIKVMVIPFTEYKKTVEANPFKNEDPKFAHINFLSTKPKSESLKSLIPYIKNEKTALKDKALYIYYTDGQAKTKLTNQVIESKLAVNATARNLNTCNKLIEIANS